MTTKGTWYYDGQGNIYSTYRRENGPHTLIAELAIGPDTEANGEFIVRAVRHLREVLALCDELTAPMENDDGPIPNPNA